MGKSIQVLRYSETKIEDSFPNAQFKTEGYKHFRKDRDTFGG